MKRWCLRRGCTASRPARGPAGRRGDRWFESLLGPPTALTVFLSNLSWQALVRMADLTWDALSAKSARTVDELQAASVPDDHGVYIWWRNDEPVYIDWARRLAVRLTRIDTHQEGTWSSRSTFRARVRLLLEQLEALDRSADADDRSAAIDNWVADCKVSWEVTESREAARAAVDDLLTDRRPLLHVWRPRVGEDEWLQDYFERLNAQGEAGRFYVEVPIGGTDRYGQGARTRYIDAVRLPGVEPAGIRYYHPRQFESDVKAQPVELIEVKRTLNRTVIGQLIVARDMTRVEWPAHGPVRVVALCTQGDPALEWICEDRGIDIELSG